MGKERCCCNSQTIKNAIYVYADVKDSITLTNEEVRSVDAYQCIRGNLAGFDPVTGVFTAPKTALYDVSVWADYRHSSTGTVLDGVTNTQLRRELIENICGGPGSGFGGLNIVLIGQTAPFSLVAGTGTNPISSSSLGGSVPLRAGEQLKVVVYQENVQTESVQLFLELMIVQREYINLDSLRGPGVGT